MWISNVCSCLLQDRWQLAQGPTRELAGCLKPEKNEVTKWHSVLSTFPPPFKQRRMETKVLGKTVAVLMALQEENTFEYHFLSKGHSTILSQKAKLPYLVSQSLRSPDRGLAALKQNLGVQTYSSPPPVVEQRSDTPRSALFSCTHFCI